MMKLFLNFNGLNFWLILNILRFNRNFTCSIFFDIFYLSPARLQSRVRESRGNLVIVFTGNIVAR